MHQTSHSNGIKKIPMMKPKQKSLQTGKNHTCKLRHVPTVATSPTCKLAVQAVPRVPCFCTGTCDKNLKFCNNLEKVCKGQNNPELQVQRMSTEDAPMAQTNDSIMECLDTIQNSVFLACSSMVQKHCMRKCTAKPCSVTTCKWLA